MSRQTAYCALLVTSAVLLVLSVMRPEYLSDDNGFLADFVNHELLAVLGVMLTITLASAGQLHLTLNDIEARHKKRFLIDTRRRVHQAAYCLIGLFLFAVALVVIKPCLPDHPIAQALSNSIAVIIILWVTLIIEGLTRLIFAIRPEFDAD